MVTSSPDVAARNYGLDKLPEHDLRYDVADEASGVLVAPPDQIAGQMAETMEEVGGDGFLFSMGGISRRSLAEVADGLVPMLQRHGLTRRAYAHAQFRDNLREF